MNCLTEIEGAIKKCSQTLYFHYFLCDKSSPFQLYNTLPPVALVKLKQKFPRCFKTTACFAGNNQYGNKRSKHREGTFEAQRFIFHFTGFHVRDVSTSAASVPVLILQSL